MNFLKKLKRYFLQQRKRIEVNCGYYKIYMPKIKQEVAFWLTCCNENEAIISFPIATDFCDSTRIYFRRVLGGQIKHIYILNIRIDEPHLFNKATPEEQGFFFEFLAGFCKKKMNMIRGGKELISHSPYLTQARKLFNKPTL